MSKAKTTRRPLDLRYDRPSGMSADLRPAYAPRPVEADAYNAPLTMAVPGASRLLGPDGRPLHAAQDAARGTSLCGEAADFLRGQTVIGSAGFIGYASCANLAQDGLIRLGVETLADEMTREWGRLTGPDGPERERLETMLEGLRARQAFHDAASACGYFGVAYLFIDTGARDPEELMTPLTPSAAKLGGAGGIRRLIPIDPVLMAPGEYDAQDPLSRFYFRPRWYWVLSRRIHESRLLRFVQHDPPLLLKAAYNFGGIPAAQLALDYLAHFTQTRESAARLLKKFSLTVFKSNLQGLLYGVEGAEGDIVSRLRYFAANRDNDGVEMIDKEEEDIIQINTPLAGVTEIVRQALEMLAAVWHMPVTKYLGVSPGGMNATGESDSRNWYDYAGSQQVAMLGPALLRLLDLLQAQTLGGVNPAYGWEWLPLWTPSAREVADTNKLVSDAAVALVGAGVISPEEGRAALARDDEGPWASLDVAPEEDRGEDRGDAEPVEPQPRSGGLLRGLFGGGA